MAQSKQNAVKFCSKCFERPIDTKTKYKTCCRSCATQRGNPSHHDPVCDVRHHEYKQNKNDYNSNDMNNNNDLNMNNDNNNDKDDKSWRCVLCNWNNKAMDNKCTICDRPKPNKKRKLEELNSLNDVCPDSSSPFHVCSQICVNRWGVGDQANIDSNIPPTKKQKIDDNHNGDNNHNHNGNEDDNDNGNEDGKEDDNCNDYGLEDDEWRCSLCTMININDRLMCSACQTEKGAEDEIVLKRLQSQQDELERNKRIQNIGIESRIRDIQRAELNDSFDIAQSDGDNDGLLSFYDDYHGDDVFDIIPGLNGEDINKKDGNDEIEMEPALKEKDGDNKEKKNEKKKKKSSMKEEMDTDDDEEEEKEEKEEEEDEDINKENMGDNNNNNDDDDDDDDLSEHESDDDVALEMFKNGLTPKIVEQKIQQNNNNNNNDDSFDIDSSMIDNVSSFNTARKPSKYATFNANKHNEYYTKKKNTKSNHNGKDIDLLFTLPLSQYLERSGFTYIKDDSDDRYIADMAAQSALDDEEYWDGHNMANTIPFKDTGDELDSLINGFDHGTIASKKVYTKTTKLKTKLAGFAGINGDNGDDDEIDENTVKRVNIQREFQYAMRTGQIVKCRLIRRRIYDDMDDGDTHFRICESQFMRSCNRGITSNGMQKTLKEVIYVINPDLIKKFQRKKNEMRSRLGSNGINTILAWHGTPSTNIDSIVEDNFSISHLSKNSGDTGWYGAGIYFSEYANISQGYGDGLLLCKIMLGKTYKMKNIKVGCDKKSGYDSHMAGGNKYGTEIVIFNMEQILPCYIVKY